MKDLKTLLEGSILADVEDTLNVTGAEALCKTIEKGLLSDNASKQKKAVEELKNLLDARQEETTVIMTGIQLSDEVCALADEVSKIDKVNFRVYPV